jgi:hypothetical protein
MRAQQRAHPLIVSGESGLLMTTNATDLTQLARCCEAHDDWRVLAEHLVADFPSVAAGDVVRELTRAKDAVAAFALDEADAFAVAELMSRHQLLLLTGEARDIARLDPERHVRGGSTT